MILQRSPGDYAAAVRSVKEEVRVLELAIERERVTIERGRIMQEPEIFITEQARVVRRPWRRY